ncbi:hypothetical protein OF83DRAFT_1089561, partial [Amylostereum chailletii]
MLAYSLLLLPTTTVPLLTIIKSPRHAFSLATQSLSRSRLQQTSISLAQSGGFHAPIYLQILATIAHLEQEKAILQAEKIVLQSVFDSIVATRSSSLVGVVFVILYREDYPNIPHWTCKEYSAHNTSIKSILLNRLIQSVRRYSK